jgi:hypothetical protein
LVFIVVAQKYAWSVNEKSRPGSKQFLDGAALNIVSAPGEDQG